MHASANPPGRACIMPTAPLLPKLVLPSCWLAPPRPLDVASTEGSMVAVFFKVAVVAVVANVSCAPFGDDS